MTNDVARPSGQSNGEKGSTLSLTTFSSRVSAALLSCAPIEGRDKWLTALTFDTGLSESTLKNLIAGTVDASGPTLDALRVGLGVDGARFIGMVFNLIGISHAEAALARDANIVRAATELCASVEKNLEHFRKAGGR